MATTSITFLPRLDLAQTSALEEGKIANLMSDVISLLLTMDTAICDLCGFSDPINHAEVLYVNFPMACPFRPL